MSQQSVPRRHWFLPGDGIAREVITADIQRYLGPDALVKPGKHEGVDGYWITAYRTLTSHMVQDLQSDSYRWRTEMTGSRLRTDSKDPDYAVAAYQGSQIHQSRQYHGPTAYTAQPAYADRQHQVHSRPEAQVYDTAGYGYSHSQPSAAAYSQQAPQHVHPSVYGQPQQAKPASTHHYQAIGREAEVYYQTDQRVTYPYATTAAPGGQPVYAASSNPPQYYYDTNRSYQPPPPPGGTGRRHGA